MSLTLSALSPSLAFWASSACSLTTSSSVRSAATSLVVLLGGGDIDGLHCPSLLFLKTTIWAGSGAADKSLVRSSLDLVRTNLPLTSNSLKKIEMLI